jgi:hypothetical protein
MKRKLILQAIILHVIVFTAFAQQGINYKAIINDDNGEPLANSVITIQFTILENGTVNVYQESHNPTTDPNGIIVVNIGEGSIISGNFQTIGWGGNPHFLKTEVDIGEGLNDMGTVEFNAVPYALHAETAKTTSSSTTYSIGLNNALGGYVFYVTPDGKHGVVAETQDQAYIPWYISSHYINCYQYHSTDGKNFTDWRLPNLRELILMHSMKNEIGGFVYSIYWSATESDYHTAYVVDFGSDSPSYTGVEKGMDYGMRAVRSF